VNVIYVAGWMRSGTTLLTEMLAPYPGVLAAGELSGLWQAVVRNSSCTCGMLIRDCSVWGAGLESAARDEGVATEADYARMVDLSRRVNRTRRCPEYARLIRRRELGLPDDVARYIAVTEATLRGALDASRSHTVVDSSKLPAGILLHELSGRDVTVAHVWRDARAVAYSESKTRNVSAGLGEEPPGRGPAKSLFFWVGANLSVRFYSRNVGNYAVIDYVDLTSSPALSGELVERLLPSELRGRRGAGQLGVGHIAVGNPRRFGGAERSIVTDEKWRNELPRLTSILLGLASFPVKMLLRSPKPRRS
jgi:hypothetical protein